MQRWPAVPKPPNSAPSTARSTSASSITTIGFLPPSSRHGDCRWRPQSPPISRADRARAGEADLVDQALLQRGLQAREGVRRPRPARRSGRRRARRPRGRASPSASPSAALYSAGFQTTALPHRIAGTRYQAGTATGKLPAVMIAATPTGMRKVKSCLFGHLRRHGLPVQPAALAEEEVARVDDLLDLAQRLRIRLADLARDEPRQRLLVGLDEPADLRDHAPARRRRHGGPLLLRGARGTRGVDERRRVAEQRPRRRPRRCWRGSWRSACRRERQSAPRHRSREATLSAPSAPEAGSEAMEDMGQHGSWPAPVFRYGELHRDGASAALSASSAGDVDRIGAAQDGGVDRDEVAEQDQRDEPLDRRRRRAPRRAAPAKRRRPRRSAVSSARSALRGCAPGSSSDT